ncbi:hypothetical protein PCANC_12873 [Puccinia coronata f. sp. avenae]|uniref:Uncharacterized protein n=1 Tax=Puccinia coronata f. sp. avenae TaxID=200324 RepID=A0A2N5UB91_9BASI|nr:hypothetical protein PCASD_15328 [Puccinia coronata f. sp. avenae]PLW48302.1 hypothetical protein PCANC_12873 [Puccinia coronata f. sp. avenae]
MVPRQTSGQQNMKRQQRIQRTRTEAEEENNNQTKETEGRTMTKTKTKTKTKTMGMGMTETNSDIDTEQTSSDTNNDSDSNSTSSESDDTQPDTNNSHQEQTFVLHRHLDYSFHHPPRHSGHHHQQQQQTTTTTTGFDLFTAQTWVLDDHQLSQMKTLKDTDLVQIHFPIPTKPEPPKNISLADILPPHNPPPTVPTKNAVPKNSTSPFAGPSVASLYYSAYSSFAPCYDSTGSSQTLDQARMQLHSRQKMEDWSRRAHRYQQVAMMIDAEPAVADNLSSSANHHSKKKKPHHPTTTATSTRGRKRQKTTTSSATASTPTSSPAKEPPASPDKMRQEVNATLMETSKLLSNLQERQWDRLRASQDVAALDPALSVHPRRPIISAPQQQQHQQHLARVPPPGREEMAEAHQLVQRLTSVLARRPRPAIRRPAGDDEDHDVAAPDTWEAAADESVIPSADTIRKSYSQRPLAVGAGGTLAARAAAVYSGQLPATNPVGIPDATLVAEPSPQLMSVLEHTQRSMVPGSLATPRALPSLMPSHAPSYSTSSSAAAAAAAAASSRRDPSLTNARIGSAGPPTTTTTMMGEGLGSRPALNGQTVHSNISKLQHLQQQQQQQQHATTGPMNQHHHPALQAADLSMAVRPSAVAPASVQMHTQADQQRHLQQLQLAKLHGSSYALPAHHRLATTTNHSPLSSSPANPNPAAAIPTIATPSLRPVAASLPRLDLPDTPRTLPLPPHPNHRALASSSSNAALH